MEKERCSWCLDGGILQTYHDEEWGNCLHEDKKHFEYLLMEAMQCGLNWKMMLQKREVFRKCFADFDYQLVAEYGEEELQSILNTEGMIRSRRKIEAVIQNAGCFLKVIEEWGSFDRYIWSFSNYHTRVYREHQQGNGEVKNDLSDQISGDMKKRGFRYLGSITIFSHLQACGIINDHQPNCYKYRELVEKSEIEYV